MNALHPIVDPPTLLLLAKAIENTDIILLDGVMLHPTLKPILVISIRIVANAHEQLEMLKKKISNILLE